MITGIIVALPEELGTLTRKKIAPGSCSNLSAGIMVACAGAGIDNAGSAAGTLIERGCSRLLSWGCAAALEADLRPGDLLLPEVLIAENRERLPVDAHWHRMTMQLLDHDCQPVTRSLCESSRLVATSAAKRTLRESHGCCAVDMESAAIARTAARHGVPFLVIRSIADPAEMDLPRAIGHALDEQGRVRMGRLLRFITRHPQEIPGLIKLGRHFHAATHKLVHIARDLERIVSCPPDRTDIQQLT